jgi:hypothetical protein
LAVFTVDPLSTIYKRAPGDSAVFTAIATRRDPSQVADSSRALTLPLSASRPKRQ